MKYQERKETFQQGGSPFVTSTIPGYAIHRVKTRVGFPGARIDHFVDELATSTDGWYVSRPDQTLSKFKLTPEGKMPRSECRTV